MYKKVFVASALVFCSLSISFQQAGFAMYSNSGEQQLTPDQLGLELIRAATNGDTRKVIRLIEDGANVNQKNPSGRTPLYGAALRGNVEPILALLKAGAQVNEGNNDGDTPLHQAVSRGYFQAVVLLLEYGADMNQPNKAGNTPLDLARQGNEFILELLTRVNSFPVHFAVSSGRIEKVRSILEQGADVNQFDDQRGTPLHLAVSLGKIDIVHALLERGANANLVDRDGLTPLELAEEHGYVAILNALLEVSDFKATINYPRVATPAEHAEIQAAIHRGLENPITLEPFREDAHIVAHIVGEDGNRIVHAVDMSGKGPLQFGHRDSTSHLGQATPVGCPLCRSPHGFFSSSSEERRAVQACGEDLECLGQLRLNSAQSDQNTTE